MPFASSSPALAQDYPNRTIRIIVPVGVGGITDILARLVGRSISDQLGQPVVIDNRTGAGGIIGTRAVAQAVIAIDRIGKHGKSGGWPQMPFPSRPSQSVDVRLAIIFSLRNGWSWYFCRKPLFVVAPAQSEFS